MTQSLILEDFARLFGTSTHDFEDECKEFIARADFRYTKLSSEKRDQTILGIIKKIDSGQLECAGKERQDRWERGWRENLQDFIASGYDLAKLVPKYVRPNQVLRLDRDYVMSSNANFELSFFTVLRLWLFKKYLRDFGTIYEFACGTGYNLVVLASLFPEKELWGLDWSSASVEMVNLIGKKHGMNIAGHLFDMFSPDYDLKVTENSAIMTIGGLEQLGNDYEAFVRFLIEKAPELCIHVEPISELYDEDDLVDYLAIRFHKGRNYLLNFLINLQRLESENEIEIIKTQRVHFGSLYHDGWSLVIWRPKKVRTRENR